MKREHSKKYVFNYGCECHEIDAKTLALSLETLNEVIDEINGQLQTGKKIELKVKALQDGSFEVNLDIVQLTDDNILTGNATSHISQIITLINKLVEIGIFLDEKPPIDIKTSDNMVILVNHVSNEYMIDKESFDIFTKNDYLSDLVRKHFLMLNDDDKITSFTIIDDEEKPVVSINKNAFRKIAVSRLMQKEEKVITDIAHLTVFKIVFDKKYKWEFIYKGHKISATITDLEFYKQIDQGERFAQGDVLLTDIKITQKFDTKLNAYINQDFEVTKVQKHIPRDEQTRLHLG